MRARVLQLRFSTFVWTVLCAVSLGAACAGTPDTRCDTTPGEGSLAIECPQEDDWSERAVDEAQEGFEERSPGTR